MDDLLRDLPFVKVYLDGILISGRTEQEHWNNVQEVLRRFQRAGVRLQLEKCVFAASEQPYLEYVICRKGLKIASSKVRAIVEVAQSSPPYALLAILEPSESSCNCA